MTRPFEAGAALQIVPMSAASRTASRETSCAIYKEILVGQMKPQVAADTAAKGVNQIIAENN